MVLTYLKSTSHSSSGISESASTLRSAASMVSSERESRDAAPRKSTEPLVNDISQTFRAVAFHDMSFSDFWESNRICSLVRCKVALLALEWGIVSLSQIPASTLQEACPMNQCQCPEALSSRHESELSRPRQSNLMPPILH